MREIKFRGKRKDSYNHEWVYGSYMDSYFSSRYGLVTAIFFNNYEICKTFRIPVFKNTVGQFTGLKDKNGVEIYEGDIVEINEKGRKLFGTETKLYDKYQVVLEKDGCYMNMSNIQYKESIKNKEFLGRITYLWITKEYATVVGNIYDNPELLENT